VARILIADDHPFFLDGLEKFLGSSGHEVVAHAYHARDVYVLIEREKPDLVMLDVNMPPSSGIEILKTLRSRGCDIPVILVTADIAPADTLEAIRNDVNGVVMKHSAPDLLMRSVDAALAGEGWIDPDIMERARKESASRQGGSAARANNLTQREHVIAMLVARGLRNREIAEQVDVTEGTIKVHLHNIYKKLEVRSRTALALIVKEDGRL
jgi:two-component system nitrate/nitrite response regulator NarP